MRGRERERGRGKEGRPLGTVRRPNLDVYLRVFVGQGAPAQLLGAFRAMLIYANWQTFPRMTFDLGL